jgi:hypothetical protein
LRFPNVPEEIIGYFNNLPELLCPAYVERDVIAFRTAWHPDGCPPRTPPENEPGVYRIDIGADEDARFIGWGWHGVENIAGLTVRWTGVFPEARVYLDLPADDYVLTFTAQAFWETRTVQVLVNDVPVGEPFTVTTDALHEYRVMIPADAIDDGQHITVTLDYDAEIVPVEVGQSGDMRRLAVMVDWLEFRAGS